jgi:hypothetical protein
MRALNFAHMAPKIITPGHVTGKRAAGAHCAFGNPSG